MTTRPRTTPRAQGARLAALGAVLSLVALTCLEVGTAPSASAADIACSTDVPSVVAGAPPALARLDSERAWDLATGRGVVVAVVDSGVDAGNAHLRGVVQGDANIVAADGGPASDNPDDFGHGTAIAGEIAAREVPGSGVVGLAKDATILSVRVFYDGTEDIGTAAATSGKAPPTTKAIAEGIAYAAAHGAKIINVSMSSTTDDAGMKKAVQAASDAGALVVASAGNRGTTTDTTDSPRYPAAYDGVLGVAAVDDKDQVTDTSIHGAHVDIAAPGTKVLTAFHHAGDCLLAPKDASTSFATAYVSAAAALVAQRFPDETPAQWAYRLEVTASRAIAGQRDDLAGWGVVRPYAALAFVDDGSAPGPRSPRFASAAPPGVAVPAMHLGARPDPLAPAQSIALWWLLGGGAALIGVLLFSRLGPRRR